MRNSNTTVTSPDRDTHPTVLEVKAAEMGLPRVIWQDPGEYYRIVLAYSADEDTIDRVFEHCEGWDALGVKRWCQVPTHSFVTGEGESARATMDQSWYHLACMLMVDAAPWPDSAATGPAAEKPGPKNRGQAEQTHALSVDKLVAAESALLDAFYGVVSAYRMSDSNTVDDHLLVAQDALAKLAEALGMDLSREPFRAPLSALQGDA